jgi:GNAT superfamily N-acetyltransferase
VAESAIEQDVNRAVGERWRRLDPLLPEPGAVTAAAETFWTRGRDGFAACRHFIEPAIATGQTWNAAAQYTLTPRVAGPDIGDGLDQLLAQWRDHVSGLPEAYEEDTGVRLLWPTRDADGVRALLKHGLQPLNVIAARPAKRAVETGSHHAARIRRAMAADLATAVRFQLDVIRYDEQFGVGKVRPATETLIREDLVTALNSQPSWIWLAEDQRSGEPVGLLILQPSEQAGWIARLVGPAPVAYLATMFVQPAGRGAGIGAALVREAHAAADESGAAVILLHYAQVNPVSGPFWSRMGYRPLWTYWEASPAALFR